MRIGYIRCSTAEQNEARQVKMLEERQVEKFFTDKASGKKDSAKTILSGMQLKTAFVFADTGS